MANLEVLALDTAVPQIRAPGAGDGYSVPRDMTFASGTVLSAPTVDATNVEVTNIKAKDGTAAASIADSTGVVSITANPILSAGTANGVLYLNGSKVATSGSGFTYDGTSALISGGNFRINRATNTSILTLGGSPTDNWEGEIQFVTSNSAVNWRLASNRTTGGAFTITPSTAGGGSTFTTPAMTIDNASNVGIGTSSPSGRLSVKGSTADSSANALFVENSSGAAIFRVRNDGDIYMGSGGKAILDSSGNLGLGVTPSAWFSASRVYQFGSGGALEGRTNESQYFALTANQYIDSAGAFKYIGSTFASRYQQYDGVHSWFTAPSGTAGNTITFTQAMTLDSSGNLGIGATSPANKLQVNISSATAYSSGATGNGLTLYNTSTTNNQYVGIVFQGEPTAGNGGLATIYGTTTSSGNMDLTFSTRGSSTLAERMRIDASGNLGIGTTSPSGKLQVAAANTRVRFSNTAGTASTLLFGADSGETFLGTETNAPIYFITNNTERARITAAGDVGIGTTTPGQKLEVAGNQRFTGSQVGTKIENRQTAVSVSTATTILDDAGALGRFVVVNGEASGDRFCDLVLCSTGVNPTVVSSFTVLGTPAARTYTRSGAALQLAMASGTYSVYVLALGY